MDIELSGCHPCMQHGCAGRGIGQRAAASRRGVVS